MTRSVLLATVVAFSLAPPAWSHHSHAMFDHSKTVTMSGTVTEFVYRNPHVFLYIDVSGADGKTQNYWIELSNIPNMIRRGVLQNTFKVGDKISVDLYPLKDGRPGGSYVTITAADGKTYQ